MPESSCRFRILGSRVIGAASRPADRGQDCPAAENGGRGTFYSHIALLLILAVAAFFRLYRLDAIPPGLTHDEADTGHFVVSVYQGEPSTVDVPYGYAYKPFTKYSGALFMVLFGPTDLALRLHAAFFGIVLVLFTYLWGREAFSVAVGLGSAALMAVSFWPVSTSRFALNPPPASALFTAAAYFLWRALDIEGERSRWWAWGLFAVLLAGSLYAYETAIAVAPSFVLLFVYLAGVDRSRFRRHGAWFAGALIIAGLLAAPHLLARATWSRAGAQAGPLRAARQGNLSPLLHHALSALGTFSFSGDSLVTYNSPGRPILDPVTGLFFYGGILLCVWRWKATSYAFTLLWMVMGIAPSLVTGEWGSTLHSGGAKVPVLVLPSLCAVEVGRFLTRRFGSHWSRLFAIGCIAWLVVVAGVTGYDYFVRWGQAPETRAAYFSNLAAIMDYLDGVDYSGAVALSSPFPDLPHDPFIAKLRLQRQDLSLRWFDARRALVFPGGFDQLNTGVSRSLFILPPNTPLAPAFAGRLDLRRIERVQLRPDDVDPYFDVLEWHPTTVLSELMVSTSRIATAGGEPRELPVNVGNAVEFLGYDVQRETVAPGGTVSLITFWCVRGSDARSSDHPMGPVPEDAYGHSVTIFAHMLNVDSTSSTQGGNRVVAQEDRLDAPAWNWHAGDVFAQVHQIELSADVSPGVYHLEVGLYDNNDEDLARLPILVNGVAVDDHLLLRPLEVTGR